MQMQALLSALYLEWFSLLLIYGDVCMCHLILNEF